MTIQQALTRCIPALMSQDAGKIIEAFSDTARDFLKEGGMFPYEIKAEAFQEKLFSLPPSQQAMIAAIVEILHK